MLNHCFLGRIELVRKYEAAVSQDEDSESEGKVEPPLWELEQ